MKTLIICQRYFDENHYRLNNHCVVVMLHRQVISVKWEKTVFL